MTETSQTRRWLSNGLLLAAGLLVIVTINSTWRTLSIVDGSQFQLDPQGTQTLRRGVIVAGAASLLIPVILVVAALRIRHAAVVPRSHHRPLVRFGLLGLMGLITFVAIAVRFPGETFLVTVMLPIAVFIVAGCLAIVLYPIVAAVRWLRRTEPDPAK